MRYPNEIITNTTKRLTLYNDVLTSQDPRSLGIDMARGSMRSLMRHMTAHPEDLVYRVNVDYAGCVTVMSFGIGNVDSDEDATYDSIQELPQWIQERIAVLSMMSHEPPTANVEGVGRRISKSVYWVYKPSTR